MTKIELLDSPRSSLTGVSWPPSMTSEFTKVSSPNGYAELEVVNDFSEAARITGLFQALKQDSTVAPSLIGARNITYLRALSDAPTMVITTETGDEIILQDELSEDARSAIAEILDGSEDTTSSASSDSFVEHEVSEEELEAQYRKTKKALDELSAEVDEYGDAVEQFFALLRSGFTPSDKIAVERRRPYGPLLPRQAKREELFPMASARSEYVPRPLSSQTVTWIVPRAIASLVSKLFQDAPEHPPSSVLKELFPIASDRPVKKKRSLELPPHQRRLIRVPQTVAKKESRAPAPIQELSTKSKVITFIAANGLAIAIRVICG